MTKRALIAGLWFLAIWAAGGPVVAYLGIPRATMLIPAFLVAGMAWFGLAIYQALSTASARDRVEGSAQPTGATLDRLPTA